MQSRETVGVKQTNISIATVFLVARIVEMFLAIEELNRFDHPVFSNKFYHAGAIVEHGLKRIYTRTRDVVMRPVAQVHIIYAVQFGEDVLNTLQFHTISSEWQSCHRQLIYDDIPRARFLWLHDKIDVIPWFAGRNQLEQSPDCRAEIQCRAELAIGIKNRVKRLNIYKNHITVNQARHLRRTACEKL